MLFGEIVNSVGGVVAVEDDDAAKELTEWQGVNSSVGAILEISDFEVREPLLLSKENNKEWLRTGIEGDYDIAGCVFLDYRSNLRTAPVKLVHGHNMNDGSMFGRLPELLQIESCDDAPEIRLYTEEGWRTYRVFSVMSVNSDEEALPVDLLATYDDVTALSSDLLDRSIVGGGQVTSADILVLNTCWYGESGVERNLHCIVSASRAA